MLRRVKAFLMVTGLIIFKRPRLIPAFLTLLLSRLTWRAWVRLSRHHGRLYHWLRNRSNGDLADFIEWLADRNVN
jgi:hypothetical protein